MLFVLTRWLFKIACSPQNLSFLLINWPVNLANDFCSCHLTQNIVICIYCCTQIYKFYMHGYFCFCHLIGNNDVSAMQRSSHQWCSIRKRFLKNFSIFIEKPLCWTLFLIKLQASELQLYQKETPTQVFSCEYCKNFKNIYFEEHLQMTAASSYTNWLISHTYIWACSNLSLRP